MINDFARLRKGFIVLQGIENPERVLYNFYQSLERRHPAISNENINTVILLKSGGKSWTS